MVFSAPTAKNMILISYVNGGVSRSKAMKLMGFSWYGELLDALSDANMNAPSLPKKELAVMAAHAKSVLEKAGNIEVNQKAKRNIRKQI